MGKRDMAGQKGSITVNLRRQVASLMQWIRFSQCQFPFLLVTCGVGPLCWRFGKDEVDEVRMW